MNLGQSVGVEVVRNKGNEVVCEKCGNKKFRNVRCEYCGENPQEKE